MRAQRVAGGITAQLLAFIVLWNLLQNLIWPDWSYTLLNTLAAIALVWWSRYIGMSRSEIGTEPSMSGRGLRVGLAVGLAAVGLLFVGIVLEPLRDLFADERAAELTSSALVFAAVLRIPLGTALFEEVLFRGVLLGWMMRLLGRGRAIALSSALFGLWHVLPTWRATSLFNEGAIREAGTTAAVFAVAGSVIATSVIGAFLAWLRLRMDSVLAPIVVHAVVNSAALLVAWSIAN